MYPLFTLSVFLTLISFHGITYVVAQKPPFGAIYQFGDSMSDTGNDIKLNPNDGCGKVPYGKTFGKPTGRCSDGLIMVDYFAQSFKIPLLSPFLDKSGDFTHGANFAVAGATAVSTSKSSLAKQLAWFKTHIATKCSNKKGGEIGGNDYNSQAFGGSKNPLDLKTVTPKVVQAIRGVITQLIDLGATRLLVPGNLPAGCMPIYLVTYKNNDKNMYDELGCLKNWNELAKYHNDQLQIAIKAVQRQYPDVKIVYGDYFSAVQTILRQPGSLGFDKNGIHKACCGGGNNEYNYGGPFCGNPGATTCPDPKVLVSWDGIHLTQHAHLVVANQLMKQFIPIL